MKHYRSQKQAAPEVRQARREAWETRMQENTLQLPSRLSRLETALERRRSSISSVEEMSSSARYNAHRGCVEDWINDEQETIDQILDKVEQTEE